jgi:hypothetical protein
MTAFKGPTDTPDPGSLIPGIPGISGMLTLFELAAGGCNLKPNKNRIASQAANMALTATHSGCK